MRNRLLAVGAVAFLAYVLGTRAARVKVVRRESVGHQLVRLWNEPGARRRRRRAARALERRRR